MKHIKLFEDLFNETTNQSPVGTNYKAICVFLETQMAVGVFPAQEARLIYSQLSGKITPDMDYVSLEMTDLPEDHDLVIVPMGGRDISTSNEDELANYGDPLTDDIIELGKNCDYADENRMVFKADKDIKGFVVLDSAGHTRLETPEAIINYV